MFELAKRHGQGPIKISEVAGAQAIPLRFLQVILNQLRGGDLSHRNAALKAGISFPATGSDHGSEIIPFMEGPIAVACMQRQGCRKCEIHGGCVSYGCGDVLRKPCPTCMTGASFQDLVDDHTACRMPLLCLHFEACCTPSPCFLNDLWLQTCRFRGTQPDFRLTAHSSANLLM
jgi:hypothetical protein